MKILIATGIYPPKTSGPAQYAYNMNNLWGLAGHHVTVKTYGIENRLPTGIRHLFYLLKIIPSVVKSDFVFVLDTFSVGLPVMIATTLFNKKVILRTGGDFLWEGYVERTRHKVLLRNFYTTYHLWTIKERLIFRLTRWVLHRADLIIFSTSWQRDIWMQPYKLETKRIEVIENHYDNKEQSHVPKQKNFIAGVRPLVWKNIDILDEVFSSMEVREVGAIYDKTNRPFSEFMDTIAHSYATILVSLGDISPHMILDSIRHNKPFILTEENGLMDRIGHIAITVDPLNADDIKNKILWLCNRENYEMQVAKIRDFNFIHTWDDISKEIINLYNKI